MIKEGTTALNNITAAQELQVNCFFKSNSLTVKIVNEIVDVISKAMPFTII